MSVVRAFTTIEWPTILIGLLIYASFGLLTWYYHALPWWLVLPLASYIVAWHGSLQHEVVHHHPTQYRWLNRLLVLPSLWLWIPFEIYRDSHRVHHHNAALTDPLQDPESFYYSAEAWQKLSFWRQNLARFYNTLLGRLLLGPVWVMAQLLQQEGQRVHTGDWRYLPAWGGHILACSMVLGWVMGICEISVFEYLLLFVYPGISLSLLRSFLEHQAHEDWRQRTVSIEAHPLLALLFLNNNLHLVHHLYPGLPWYRLPKRWQQHRDVLMQFNGGYYYPGYGVIFSRYLMQAKEPVLHPQAAPAYSNTIVLGLQPQE